MNNKITAEVPMDINIKAKVDEICDVEQLGARSMYIDDFMKVLQQCWNSLQLSLNSVDLHNENE